MRLWQSDEELFSLAEKQLFTCVVGDVLDKQNLVHQYLPPEIRPLSPQAVLIGRAMPVLAGGKKIHPTAVWQTMPTSLTKDQFDVATDLYYIRVVWMP